MDGKRRSCSNAAGDVPRGKRRRTVGSNFSGCCMNELYSSTELCKGLQDSWKNSSSFQNKDGSVELLKHPFQCCILKDFLSEKPTNGTSDAGIETSNSSSMFLENLETELLKLKFYEKNNDLYQFHQSDDLKKFKSPCISGLRSVFHNEVLPWLRSVTGVELTDTIDMTCSKYSYTDVLLCHDDELEGRRIAFILYLVPDNWLSEDGGSLDLFDTDDYGQPRTIVRSILPVRNSFIFFDVNEKSFHQVAEILSTNKPRLSVNGWFHGPPSPRSLPHCPVSQLLAPPTDLCLEVLSDWINPMYLDVGTQAQIQQQFEADSQIQLQDFLLEEKYSMLCKELQECDRKKLWAHAGPPNRKCTDILSKEQVLPVCHDFFQLVTSKPFCLLLSHMTELELVDNMIKADREGNGGSSSCNGTSSANSKSSITSTDGESESTGSGESECSISNRNEDIVKLTSSSLCCSHLNYWHPGNYLLAGDPSDPGLGKFCLEMFLHFNSEDWCEELGGTINYIADDADEEFLTLTPQPNSLSLVYRDKDLLRFTKYINHRSLSVTPISYHSVSATYLEKIHP